MIFLGESHDSQQSYGDTRVSSGFNDLWLYTAAMPNVDLRAEALVHEMGHQWLVNQEWITAQTQRYTGGHCDTAHGQPLTIGIPTGAGLLCTMTSGSALWSTAQAWDRHVGFHFESLPGQQESSEYSWIRDRLDPLPQNDNPRPRIIQ